MKVDCCLILAAGLSTRMGEIGKILPKPLWPIFHKTLIELEILFARKLGAKKIYINTHHASKRIDSFFHQRKDISNVQLIYENEILGVGGAIHNIAQLKEVSYRGNLLVINSDQFFFLGPLEIEAALKHLPNNLALLFCLPVPDDSPYNHLETRDNLLTNIIKSSNSIPNRLTYSGMSLINLEKLDPVTGKSNFFSSIANYKKHPIKILSSPNEYWDFGTKEIYFKSLFKLLDLAITDSDNKFLQFLIGHQSIKKEAIKKELGSYGKTSSPFTLNFSSKEVSNSSKGKAIILDDILLNNVTSAGIYYQDISS